MKVLSLFDGISACHLALTRAGFDVDTYYTAEIDRYATKISEHHYPDAVRLGDVTKWREWGIDWSNIDIVTGGFPCQSWSLAGKQLGDKDERGMLFWTMLDIMKMVLKHNPTAYFLMENVKMKKEFEDYITRHTEKALGQVEKHLINSALVSAQNRNRYYWTNIQGIKQPEDKGLVLADVIESGNVDRDKSLTVTTRVAGATEKRYLEKSMHQMVVDRDKSYCIDAKYHKGGNPNQYFNKSRRQLVFEHPCEPRDFNADSLCHHAADATDIKGHGYNKRVYAETGKCPTLAASRGGNLEPKVLCGAMRGRYIVDGKRQDHKMKTAGKTKQKLEIRNDEKTNTLTTVQKDNYVVNNTYMTYRKLTPLECERLQTLPDGWTLVEDENGKQMVSNTQRYKALGNAWTVDVIDHIFSFMENPHDRAN